MLGPYIFQFLWGLLVLLAFVGWGHIGHRLIAPNLIHKPDWGILAGWGMAFSLIGGGLLALTALVSREVIVIYVLIGVSLAVHNVIRHQNQLRCLTKRQVLVGVCIAVPLMSHYAAVVHMQANSCADDAIAYFPFITRMLDTGTLVDPYSLRRLAAYGGHTFLQALVGATGSEENAYLMDRGIGFLISFGIILGYFKCRSDPGTVYSLTPLHGIIITLIILAIPLPLLNSASHLTGLVIFLTLFRTLDLLPREGLRSFQSVWLIGVLVAAAASLRIHYLFAAALCGTLYYLYDAYERRSGVIGSIRTLLLTGLTSLACLAPWMALLYKSSGTFLYPLFPGNHRSNFEAFAGDISLSERMLFVVDILSEPRMWFLLVALAVIVVYRHNRAAFALSLAALLMTLVVTLVFTLSDVDNIHRYVAPVINAAIISTLISFVGWSYQRRSDLRSLPVSTGGCRTVIAIFVLTLIPIKAAYDIHRVNGYWHVTALPAEGHLMYKRIQESIPADETFFAMVFHPFAWNYSRNEIIGIDTPGAVSPDPGIPYFVGSGALRDYFVAQSISFAVIGDFNQRGVCLYNRRLWQFNLEHGMQIWKQGAPFYLDMMSNLEALAKEYPVIYEEAGFRVIDIR